MDNNINEQTSGDSTTFRASNPAYNAGIEAAKTRADALKNAAKEQAINKGIQAASKINPVLGTAAKAVNEIRKRKQAKEVENQEQTEQTNQTGIGSTETKSKSKNLFNNAVDEFKPAFLKKIQSIRRKAIIIGISVSIIITGFWIAKYSNGLVSNLINFTDASKENQNAKYGLMFNVIGGIANSRIEAFKTKMGIPNLDVGMIYATLNGSHYVTPTVFESDAAIDETTNYDFGEEGYDATINHDTAIRYYIYMMQYLGDSENFGDSIMGHLVGYDMIISCSETLPNNKQFATTITEYIRQEVGKYTQYGQLAERRSDGTINYRELGKKDEALEKYFDEVYTAALTSSKGSALEDDTLVVKLNELSNYIDEKYANVVSYNVKNILTQRNGCTEAGFDYTIARKNDYQKYYQFVTNLYVPFFYSSYYDQLDDDAKKDFADSVWNELVTLRNGYYEYQGIDMPLEFEYIDGMIQTNMTGSMFLGGVPTSMDAKVALGWKQMDKAWGGIVIDNNPRSHVKMSGYGCLVTSLAKLIKISGTQITSPTFDPGVLARAISSRRGFGGGFLHSDGQPWQDVAPNFKQVSYITGMQKITSDFSSQVSSIISSSGKVGDKYYYAIRINYDKSGNPKEQEHHIAIVGSDERGLILSDPTYGGETYYLDDIRRVINPTVRVTAVRIYQKLD